MCHLNPHMSMLFIYIQYGFFFLVLSIFVAELHRRPFLFLEYVTLNSMYNINSHCFNINRTIKYNKIRFYLAMSRMSKMSADE